MNSQDVYGCEWRDGHKKWKVNSLVSQSHSEWPKFEVSLVYHAQKVPLNFFFLTISCSDNSFINETIVFDKIFYCYIKCLKGYTLIKENPYVVSLGCTSL